MQLIVKNFLFIIICLYVAVPTITSAAAIAPITQEEIEAILERDQVDDISSTSLPAELRKRLGQTVASTTDSFMPAITETVNKAEQAIATATNKISSTSDRIKDNLENFKTQAKSDLNNTLLGRIADVLSSIWGTITGWFSGFFRGKPLTGATN